MCFVIQTRPRRLENQNRGRQVENSGTRRCHTVSLSLSLARTCVRSYVRTCVHFGGKIRNARRDLSLVALRAIVARNRRREVLVARFYVRLFVRQRLRLSFPNVNAVLP